MADDHDGFTRMGVGEWLVPDAIPRNRVDAAISPIMKLVNSTASE